MSDNAVDRDVGNVGNVAKTVASTGASETGKQPSSDPKTPKRRSSPLFKTVTKRGRATPTKASARTNMSFSDMLIMTFKDPNFIAGAAPLIHAMLAPMLKTVVDASVASIFQELKTSVIDKVVDSNNKLQETVNKQLDTINMLQANLDEHRKELRAKSETLENIEARMNSLSRQVDAAKRANNDLEQYGRRNSIRMSNFSYDPKATESQLTSQVVSFINKALLPDGPPVSDSDIERCHPVGRPGPHSRKQLIIKFQSYRTKYRVFSAKSRLKQNSDRVFISEDLTKLNHDIVLALLPLKKSGKINSFWTTNGAVFAKTSAEGRPIRIPTASSVATELNLD